MFWDDGDTRAKSVLGGAWGDGTNQLAAAGRRVRERRKGFLVPYGWIRADRLFCSTKDLEPGSDASQGPSGVFSSIGPQGERSSPSLHLT